MIGSAIGQSMGMILKGFSAQKAAAQAQQNMAYQTALILQDATQARGVIPVGLMDMQNMLASPKRDSEFFRRRVASCVEDGEHLIDRLMFWSAFGIVASPITLRLLRKLEAVSDEIEILSGLAECA